MLEAFANAAHLLADPAVIGAIFMGSALGFILGLMPGLGSVQGLALALPFTFGWDPLVAMFFYAGIMGSTSEGGSVTAILLNTPGTPINAATCFDGYPMARRGEAGRALGLAAASSSLGALFGIVVLTLLIPAVRPIVLSFGPPEFFWLVVFGLVTITFAARGNLFKGLAAGGTGVLVSLIGNSDLFGVVRWSGESEYLWDRLPLVPLFIGLLAISELLVYTTQGGTIARAGTERFSVRGLRQVFRGFREMFSYPVTFLRGSMIGTVIGIIPGVGGSVANFISYATALQSSKNRDFFGRGHPEGIVASESANDAKDGGSVLPTLAFGIPGSAEMAVFMGALILHGIQPGPLLIKYHMDIVVTVILGLVMSNVLAGLFLVFLAHPLARVTFVPVHYIAPGALILAALGSYAIRSNVWDVGLTLMAGIVGFIMKRYGFPVITFAIGFILGALAEDAFHQSLMIAYGSYTIFFTRPICLVLIGLILLVLVLPFFNVRQRIAGSRQAQTSWKFDTGSFIVTSLAAVLVLFMLVTALSYSPRARAVPFIVGIPTLFFLLANLGAEFFPRTLRALETGIENIWGGQGNRSLDREESVTFDWVKFFRIICWLFAFFGVVFFAGLLAGAMVFVLFFLRIEGKAPWYRAALACVVVWAFLYLLVYKTLLLRLWPGFVEETIPALLGGGVVPPL